MSNKSFGDVIRSEKIEEIINDMASAHVSTLLKQQRDLLGQPQVIGDASAPGQRPRGNAIIGITTPDFSALPNKNYAEPHDIISAWTSATPTYEMKMSTDTAMNISVFNNKTGKYMSYDPKRDITAYELAKITQLFAVMGASNISDASHTTEFIEKNDLTRHFASQPQDNKAKPA